MSTRPMLSRYALGPDHVFVRVRVAFHANAKRSFHESVSELIDSIGVLPGTAPRVGISPGSGQLDLSLVSAEEDDPNGAGASRGIVEFAVPTAVLPEEGAIPLMLAIATYGSVYRFVREYQVLDMDFPSESMPQHDLCGPKYGGSVLVPGVHDAPRLGLILKPRFSSDEQHLRWLIREVATAGIDYVTDDELTVTTPGLPFIRRVECVGDELDRVAAHTGKRVPYIANITGSYMGAVGRSVEAEELGARAVMVNTIAMGYDVVSDIASDTARSVGVVANSIGRGVITSGPGYFIAPELLCKLARLAGADGVYTGPLVGSIQTMKQHAERYRKALGQPYHRSCVRRSAAAVMSGGLGLPEIVQNDSLYRGELYMSLGRDVIVPMLDGIKATLILDCIREVVEGVRAGGKVGGREAVKRFASQGGAYAECARAIRAEEAVSG